MRRVLSVLQSLRRLEEAQLGLLQRRSQALRSAQSSSIAALNDHSGFDGSCGVRFAHLIAARIRSQAQGEKEANEQSERQRTRLAERQAQEKIADHLIARLGQQDEQRNKAVQLSEVLECYVGKPPASMP